MLNSINNTSFKKGTIVFWVLWWIIALWTDIVGGLSHIKMLCEKWAPDTNYPFLVESLKMYPIPEYLPVILFIGIIGWSFLCTVTFLWACLGLRKAKSVWLRRAEVAYICSLSFWMAFFLADQIVMKFDLEENHMVQGGFLLLCYLALYVLPDRTGYRK